MLLMILPCLIEKSQADGVEQRLNTAWKVVSCPSRLSSTSKEQRNIVSSDVLHVSCIKCNVINPHIILLLCACWLSFLTLKVIANSVKEDGTISDIIGGTGVQDRWCCVCVFYSVVVFEYDCV